MLCNICKKRESTIHLTQSINGKVTELHICEKCALEHNLLKKDKLDLSIGDILSGLMGFAELNKKNLAEKEYKCNFCGMTFGDFQRTGKLGCSECYHTFREQLEPLLRKVQGNTRHTGKIPLRVSSYMINEGQVSILQKKLEAAIKEERYEAAANLRDKISEIKEKLKDA